MTTADVFIGVLPLFHSFGFTGTMWFPLLQGAGVVYHPNPMDAKTIGEIAETYNDDIPRCSFHALDLRFPGARPTSREESPTILRRGRGPQRHRPGG